MPTSLDHDGIDCLNSLDGFSEGGGVHFQYTFCADITNMQKKVQTLGSLGSTYTNRTEKSLRTLCDGSEKFEKSETVTDLPTDGPTYHSPAIASLPSWYLFCLMKFF